MNAALLAQSEFMSTVLVLGFGGLVFAVLFLWILTKWIVVGNPSELLVISGKRTDGKGYRTLIGGRTVVIPIFE